MADSLLHALLLDSVPGFTDNDWALLELDTVKRRLLLGELYEALMRDDDIMPTLIRAILQHKGEQNSNAKVLFDKLIPRIREEFNRISRL